MRHSSIAGALICCALGFLLSCAHEESETVNDPNVPKTKWHEFNPVIPTEFSGAMIDLKTADGTPFKVYATGSADAKRQIILIHEWWGLNPHVKGMADQFAKVGYRAFAVDLYDGKSTDNPEVAQKLMAAAGENAKACQAKLDATVAHTVRENAAAKLGTVGWCFGGGWSLRTAVANKDVDACVFFYGMMIEDPKELANLNAPVLGIIADRDEWITPAKAETFRQAMIAAQKSVEIAVYPADHAFANPSGKRYQEKEAREAWAKMWAFFDAHL